MDHKLKCKMQNGKTPRRYYGGKSTPLGMVIKGTICEVKN